ncbi:MAG: heme-binding domain-containing protein [Sulfurovum sp.]|nr:heme-binding domain-containing protein [Sulfurovum sp.]
MKYTLIKVHLYIALFTFSTSLLFSHGGEKHEKKNITEVSTQKDTPVSQVQITSIKSLENEPQVNVPTIEETKKAIFKEINSAYLSEIKPIFEKKCFDCHGTLQNKPWYYNIPPISYMIQKDIEEAKEHMDMTKDFPFISHDTPYNDLKSIKEIGLKGGMPPLKYIIGHWDARLTDSDKKALVQWSQSAMQKLKDNKLNTTSEASH